MIPVKSSYQSLFLFLFLFIFQCLSSPGQSKNGVVRGEFDSAPLRMEYSPRGITSIRSSKDDQGADIIARGQSLGRVVLKYRIGSGDWLDIYTGETRFEASAEDKTLTYTDYIKGMPVKMVRSFRLADAKLDWTVTLESAMEFPVTIGDLALEFPWKVPGGSNPLEIFEKSFSKHHFISGHGSFLVFTKPSGTAPFLVVTVLPGTKLEYYSSAGRGTYRAYIHSSLSGQAENRGTWRQEHTSCELAAAGVKGSRVSYGVRLQWAQSYDEVRQILYREGLFDIRVVPGMTVPEDLTARFSLHSKNEIERIKAEYPAETSLKYLGEKKKDYHLYEVSFKRLGENLLTIIYNGGHKTQLEFFSCEPLETLIKKRSSFIVNRQQHRDPTKWYDGLFSVYDMKNKVLRGPDNTDGFDHWWGYVLACDDPALCKAPFVAAKNVHFPILKEIEAVEYYLEHFVWGKLQRSDQENPYPYGIYGTPNWMVNRDPVKRAGVKNRNLDKMNVWRSYDYPHMVMLYFHMYQIAKLYPDRVQYLDAPAYLERAFQTARAYFIYPYEILPWYETYKWGCYNELVILELIAALESEGFPDKSSFLRGEWEKKVKYFVYDDAYPFRSEYSLDRTAFESSYALAKYGVLRPMKPDKNLWWDKKLKRWYSHPKVSQAAARNFMDRQLAANLACRGWLETSYYLLGADFTSSSDNGCMSYMANMGGWAILDYAVNFASEADVFDYLQLGYASYLSSWSLMNSGRPDSNYGYWFPGPENDGASGWTFMPGKHGRAWIRKDVPRGPWHYDGEIDLGYGAGLRTAATIVTRDPLFGWQAYGGSLAATEAELSVVPRDGLRKRFYIVLGKRRLKIELDRDGFAAEREVRISRDLSEISFFLENATGDRHLTRLSVIGDGSCSVLQDGKKIAAGKMSEKTTISLTVSRPSTRIVIKIGVLSVKE